MAKMHEEDWFSHAANVQHRKLEEEDVDGGSSLAPARKQHDEESLQSQGIFRGISR